MTSQSYFYDQYSRASRLSGIQRAKRNLTEFNQALYQAQRAESIDSQKTHPADKSSQTKHSQPINRQIVVGKSQIPFVPDTLIKELDATLKTFEDKPSDDDPEDQSISNQPKVSLPSVLILQFHSTWTDLIANTEYKQKVSCSENKNQVLLSSARRFGKRKQVKMHGDSIFNENV
jgi:hypothetical protein